MVRPDVTGDNMSKKSEHEEYMERITRLFPTAKDEDFVGIQWPDHIRKFIEEIDAEYFKDADMKVPPYILKSCMQSIGLSETDFIADVAPLLKTRAHVAYLYSVKPTAKPMSEETKQKLRELNESKKMLKAEVLQKPEAEVTTTTTTKVAPVAPVAPAAEVKNKKAPSRKPIFEDKEKQEELIKKYPWAIKGSFKQDPEQPASTILSILCVDCNKNQREIHAADLFQVKKCAKCKSKRASPTAS